MRVFILVVTALTLGASVVQAASSVGSSASSATGSSALGGTAGRGQSFGASPGAPGSPSYNPNGGIVSATRGGLGALPGSPGSPNYNPNASLPSLNSPPPPNIPSLDAVMPGASTSGLLPPSGSTSSPTAE